MDMDIKIPSVGESIKTGILAAWLKADGDSVADGEEIFELETEKSTIAFPSPAAGVLSVLVEEGAEVEIDQTVATLRVGETAAAPEAPAPSPTPAVGTEEPALSPAVRRVITEAGLDPAAIEGTGKDGRITKEDATAAAAQKAAGARAAPAATPPAPAPATPPPPPVDTVGDGRPRERVPMSMIRKRTAERLVKAKQDTAYLTTFNEIDMQKVIAIRSEYREDFEKEHGIRIGFMSFFVKAACQSLKQFPAVNSMVDGEDIIYQHFYDIGIAISLETGLIVPVIRNAEKMSFAEIENTIASLAKRAREKKLLPDEMIGGTFTITNGGIFGSLLSTPIPAYPQTAIIGMHAIKKRAVVVDDQIVIRPMMYVALTYDHRVVDGREAIGFLARIKDFIEAPDKLLLEM